MLTLEHISYLKLKEFDKDLDEVIATDDKGKAAGITRYINTLFHVQVFCSNESVITDVKVSPKDRQTRHCFDKYIPRCSHF